MVHFRPAGLRPTIRTCWHCGASTTFAAAWSLTWWRSGSAARDRGRRQRYQRPQGRRRRRLQSGELCSGEVGGTQSVGTGACRYGCGRRCTLSRHQGGPSAAWGGIALGLDSRGRGLPKVRRYDDSFASPILRSPLRLHLNVCPHPAPQSAALPSPSAGADPAQGPQPYYLAHPSFIELAGDPSQATIPSGSDSALSSLTMTPPSSTTQIAVSVAKRRDRHSTACPCSCYPPDACRPSSSQAEPPHLQPQSPHLQSPPPQRGDPRHRPCNAADRDRSPGLPAAAPARQ